MYHWLILFKIYLIIIGIEPITFDRVTVNHRLTDYFGQCEVVSPRIRRLFFLFSQTISSSLMFVEKNDFSLTLDSQEGEIIFPRCRPGQH